MAFTLIGAVVNAVVWVLSTIGLPGLFVLMAVESFGLPPIPSEVILPFTGFLIVEGVFPLVGTILVAVVAGLTGAFAAYAVGRWGRDRITGMGLGALRIQASHLERMDRWFARHGEAAVGFSRLVPIVRSYISYPAGTARMDPVRFGLYSVAGATPYTLALLYSGIVLRSHWATVSSYFGPLDYVTAALLGVAVVYLALLMAGWLQPGWPPRWIGRRRPDSPPTDPP